MSQATLDQAIPCGNLALLRAVLHRIDQHRLIHGSVKPILPVVAHRALDYSEAAMEQIANLHIEKLPEGVYLATSDDIPGLVAQGRTITETLEIARDVAKKLLEAQTGSPQTLKSVGDSFDYPLILGT